MFQKQIEKIKSMINTQKEQTNKNKKTVFVWMKLLT